MSDSADKILFDALRDAVVAEQLAYTAVQEVRNMAGQNFTAELGSKIDAQRGMIWTLIGILSTAVIGGLAGLATLFYQVFTNFP